MRVLHVVNRALPDAQNGYTIRTHETVKAQQKLGIEAKVYVCEPWAWSRSYVIDGVKYIRAPRSKRGWIDRKLFAAHPAVTCSKEWRKYDALTADLERTSRETFAEIIHAHSPGYLGLLAQRAAKRCHALAVYEARGLQEDSAVANGQFPEGGLWHRFRRTIETEAVQRSDGTVFLCETIKKAFMARATLPDYVMVAPNAADERFHPDLADDLYTSLFGEGERIPVVGYIGSIRPLEGVGELLLGFKAASPFLSGGGRLLIVGEGEHRRELMHFARTLGIEDRVIFTGAVPSDQIVPYYNVMDAFVVSRPDTYVTRHVTPLKPLEAQACFLPVIASDLPALRELECTTYYKPGDAMSLAHSIINVLAQKRDEDRDFISALADAQDNVNRWESNAHRYCRFYDRLIVRSVLKDPSP